MEKTTLPKTPKHRLEYQRPLPVGGVPHLPLHRSRAAFLLISLALIAAVIALYARERWLAVVMLILTDGLCVGGWVLSAWLLGRLIVRPLRLEIDGALGFATA